MRRMILAAISWCCCCPLYSQAIPYDLPITIGAFEQQVHRPFTTEQGLPNNDVKRIYRDGQDRIVAVTAGGAAAFDGARWQTVATAVILPSTRSDLVEAQTKTLRKLAGQGVEIRAVAKYRGEAAVATNDGLYTWRDTGWRLVLPRQGAVRWAPVDVRAVAYDAAGVLWFASPQGVGCRLSDDQWKLFTGADGLPYNDFTCIAVGAGDIWFGTTNGAIRYRNGEWSFRQGRRWLLDNHVRDIALDSKGQAWLATSAGVSCIAYQRMTLADKAAYYHQEIEKYHRRTSFGYVGPAKLAVPGDRSTAEAVCTNNDGQRMGFYLAAVSLGYAATGDVKLQQDAHKAFRALAFLTKVTQGGTHPAPKGFGARAVRPTSGPDPNPEYDLAYDLRRQKRDALWKIIQPRWPIDATGQWYWMNDWSVDELDGHFLGYGTYYDRVCRSEAEKDSVRAIVRRIGDHILDHGFNLIDYDGKPTRWGRISPQDLNRNEACVIERGLRSLATLNYLSVAHQITGDQKYRRAYLELALEHGYGMNGMTQPRNIAGPGTFGQGDDKMAFMNYYHLIRYETDPQLLSMYYRAIHLHWLMERYERCPWANFIYTACCLGKVRIDQWGKTDLTPPITAWLDAALTDTSFPSMNVMNSVGELIPICLPMKAMARTWAKACIIFSRTIWGGHMDLSPISSSGDAPKSKQDNKVVGGERTFCS